MTRGQILKTPGINDILQFGKFKGKSILYVLDHEPSYLVWCINNVAGFKIDEQLKNELLRQYRNHIEWLKNDGIWDAQLKRMGLDAAERSIFMEEYEYDNEFFW